jgi:transposase-like protein
MSTPKKKVIRGKRYTPEEKNSIIAFITEHNATNGRGGQSAAAAKFGISQITLASWLKKSGVKAKRKSTKSSKTAKRKSTKSSKQSAAKSVTSTSGIQKKLGALLTLGQEIEKLERTLKTKRAQFDSLKAAL